MADLIELDAVLSDINEEIEASQEYPEDKMIRKGLRIARKYIEDAPTVNRWIPVEDAGYERIESCKVCYLNTGECEDCLFQHSKDCPEVEKNGQAELLRYVRTLAQAQRTTVQP